MEKSSVASEHDVNIEKLPKYFIDTATTKTGMSGSAVFIKSNGFTFPKGKENIDDMIMSQCYTLEESMDALN
jgi:prophage maintenance system killer protein